MRVHLLHKRHSRRAPAAQDALRAAGAQVTAIASDSAAEIGTLVSDHDPDRLVVLGGDGMVHHAVQAIAGSSVALGIMRGGTGNDIARALKIPRRQGTAARRALEPPAPMDLLRISGSQSSAFAVSVLTAGFSGLVTDCANRIGWLGGQAKYTAATVRCLPKLQTFDVDLGSTRQPDLSRELPDPCCLLAFGNTRFFGGGMAICPSADPTDGTMQIVAVAPVHPLHLSAVLPLAFVGQHLRSHKVHSAIASRMDLSISPSWWADGEELFVAGPVSIEVVPGALLIAGGP